MSYLLDRRNVLVTEFHELCDCPAPKAPVVLTSEQIRHRLRMLLEEVFELLAASFATANQLEAAKRAVFDAINFRLITFKPEKFFDALEDIDYIVEGTRVEAGIKGMSLFTEVHRANMTKAVPCAVCSGTGRQADMQTLGTQARRVDSAGYRWRIACPGLSRTLNLGLPNA